MPLVLLILLIVVPIAELYVIIQVGQAIGVLPTIGLLILDSFLGAALLRSQGRLAWARFNAALAEGRVPAREVFDGAMIILGGALLLTPGFITDLFGLFLLLPPTRALLRRGVARLAGRRLALRWSVSSWGDGPRGAGRGAGPGWPPPRDTSGRDRDYDYEGSAREVTEADPQLPDRERGRD